MSLCQSIPSACPGPSAVAQRCPHMAPCRAAGRAPYPAPAGQDPAVARLHPVSGWRTRTVQFGGRLDERMGGDMQATLDVAPAAAGFAPDRLERISEHLNRNYIIPGKIAGCQTLVARHGQIAYFHSL